MCYKYVPVSDGANIELVVVPSVHPLHHSASYSCYRLDFSFWCSGLEHLLPAFVCLSYFFILGFGIKQKNWEVLR